MSRGSKAGRPRQFSKESEKEAIRGAIKRRPLHSLSGVLIVPSFFPETGIFSRLSLIEVIKVKEMTAEEEGEAIGLMDSA